MSKRFFFIQYLCKDEYAYNLKDKYAYSVFTYIV